MTFLYQRVILAYYKIHIRIMERSIRRRVQLYYPSICQTNNEPFNLFDQNRLRAELGLGLSLIAFTNSLDPLESIVNHFIFSIHAQYRFSRRWHIQHIGAGISFRPSSNSISLLFILGELFETIRTTNIPFTLHPRNTFSAANSACSDAITDTVDMLCVPGLLWTKKCFELVPFLDLDRLVPTFIPTRFYNTYYRTSGNS